MFDLDGPFFIISVRKQDKEMETSELISAARNGDYESVKNLHIEGADINQVNSSGASAVIVAAEKNHFNIVKYLGDHGANLNIETEMGGTALQRSVEVGNMEMMHYLIDNGVKVRSLALIVAARSGNLEATRLLVEKGADVDFQQRWGHTAMMIAAKNGHIEVVKYLMEQGTNLFLKDKNGDTAMIIATENDQADIALMLKKAGANYVAKPKKDKQNTPTDEDIEVAELVIADSSDVDELLADDDESDTDKED